MKRYAKWFDEFDEDPEGDWVDYDEAVKEIAGLQRQLDEERARLDWLAAQVWYQEKSGQWADDLQFYGKPGDSLREAIDCERSKDAPVRKL